MSLTFHGSANSEIVLKKGLFVKADLDGTIIEKFGEYKGNYFIPASIIKVATASYALFTLGENYRFSTKFYITPQNDLVLVGLGDPGFTSTELYSAIKQISRNHKSFNRIILDNTFYAGAMEIPGRGVSSNPYDAPVGALAINFNTISIRVKNNSILSGEHETPLTSFAKDIGRSMPEGIHRVSVGRSGASGLQHLAQLTRIFLRREGVKVSDKYLIKKLPPNSSLILDYKSSKTLQDNVRDMLLYSNNFIANQLYFVISAYYSGPPVRSNSAQESFNRFLKKEMNFNGEFNLEEGAGLSRRNKLNLDQILSMLRYFYPYRDLLPEEKGIYYKSGSLNGISNLAGYFAQNDSPYIFVLLEKINRSIPDRLKRVKMFANSK